MRRAFFLIALAALPACAQDDYEIQVYGSETVASRATMVELHGNFRPNPSEVHETVEITHGFNSWFETGFYVFTNEQSAGGWQYVGSHLRPRVRVPEEWHWPVGVSLSTEFGFARRRFADDTWTWEIRPIIDKEAGRWYVSFNPALEKHLQFAPALNVKFNVTKLVAAGVEYYGGSTRELYPAIDLNLSPDWEFNAGVGFDLDDSSRRPILKTIVGRRFR